MKWNAFLVVMLFAGITACNKKSDPLPDPNINFSATLAGTSQVPPVTTAATGTASAVYNTDTKILKLTVTYSGLTVTQAIVAKGAPGSNGAAVYPLAVTPSPILYTSTGLPPEKEADLMAGLYYVSLRSSSYPFGEIRGQLLKK